MGSGAHSAAASRASGDERYNAQLRRHEPDEAPGEGFLERLAVEVLLVGGVQRHHQAGMIDVPPARAAAGGDRAAERILQGAIVQRRIDAGLSRRPIPHRGSGNPPRPSVCLYHYGAVSSRVVFASARTARLRPCCKTQHCDLLPTERR